MEKGLFVHSGSSARHFSGSSVYRERKEWGEEHWIVNKEYCGKKLLLKKNYRCSMHAHRAKEEVFYLQSGSVRMEVGGEQYLLAPGDFVHVPSGTPHRFTGIEESVIFEFSTNHREDDSFRTELSSHVDPVRFARQSALVRAFPRQTILVVGDAMLDTSVEGSVDRVSPEAPIPVVRQTSARHVPGGAANTAQNVRALGGTAVFVGVRGRDPAGECLQSLLRAGKLRVALFADPARRTTEKQRVLGSGNHQIVRIDYEDARPLSRAMERKVLAAIKRTLPRCGALLLSDYAKGVCTPAVLRGAIALARAARVPVILDPKPRGAEYIGAIRGLSLLTPNLKEAMVLAGAQTDDPAFLGRILARKLRCPVLITLGAGGMLLARASGKNIALKALRHDVADVSGAGDTVAATLALALAAGASLEDAVDLANRAASVVVAKPGTATLDVEELLSVL